MTPRMNNPFASDASTTAAEVDALMTAFSVTFGNPENKEQQYLPPSFTIFPPGGPVCIIAVRPTLPSTEDDKVFRILTMEDDKTGEEMYVGYFDLSKIEELEEARPWFMLLAGGGVADNASENLKEAAKFMNTKQSIFV